MGYLMKEALKTLCGVNQWAYAVFWKIGCENPKLLIWEECYYEFGSCSGLPGTENSKAAFRDYDSLSSDVGAPEKVHSLVNRMMIDSYVNVVGEGLVGRVAFTRNYQWILSENFFREARPPKVLEEVFEQFSAGLQTVAVIPVLPHGVVQFGSFLTIAENAVFVNDVTSLILQLGYALEENPSSMSNVNESPYFLDYVGEASESYLVENQTCYSVLEIRNNLQSNGNETRITPMNAVAKAEVIPYNSEMWMNRDVYAPGSSSTIGSTERKIYSDVSDRGNLKSAGASGGVLMPNSGFRCYSGDGSATRASAKSHERCKSRVIGRPSVDPFSDVKWSADGNVSPNRLNFTSTSYFVSDSIDPLMTTSTPALQYDERQFSTEFDGSCIPSQSGDDLFDVLGAEFKNKLFRGRRNGSPSNGSTHNTLWSTSLAGSEICSTSQGKSGSEIFCTEADNLLEAVVSKVRSSGKRSFDDNVSPGMTMTSTSSSPAPGASLSYGRFGVKAGATSSCSLITGPELTSTCHSKKPGGTSKTNRRRLKPGENSRPRPKDRQMIQDRVKELREIVPNGAKCSIDALLERTIKHMLFLQSVTKHADKLKQAGQSKIITKNGGATWAYEVGSQSMLCPIVVEDLNQPRQMFVEMLCEERGLFLEIADVIRGLGLTILKGVMEAQNDKIWARFAVEANRDVTRMEIFISLVRLLEQSLKQLSGIGNENAAHVPVPDRLRKLQ